MTVNVYDPRDPAQKLDDPTTWKPTSNPVLMLMHLAGEAYPEHEVNWEKVGRAASYCDRPATFLGIA